MLNCFHAALNACLILASRAVALLAMAPESSLVSCIAISALGSGTTEVVADKNIILRVF